jgi:hypothetical protein
MGYKGKVYIREKGKLDRLIPLGSWVVECDFVIEKFKLLYRVGAYSLIETGKTCEARLKT